jgi:polysaccharide chain length determinant protein (PEP-CTERM system associated)
MWFPVGRETAMIPGKTYTADDYLRMAWRRKWVILVPFVVIAIGTFVVVKRLPNLYRSETTILVVPQRVPDSYVRSTVTATIDDRLRSISEQILSRGRLERIIQDYNLYAELRRKSSLEDVVEQMRRDITVEPAKGGTTFIITYTSGDKVVARWVTETLATMFIEANLRQRVTLADGTSQFLESQLEDARGRLIAHEKKLAEYREKYANELPSQLDTNVRAEQNAEARVQAVGESINRDRDRKLLQERLLADLQAANTGAATPAGNPGGAPDPLETARTTLAELQVRLKPEHPDVLRAKRAVAQLEAQPVREKAPPQPADTRAARLTPAEAVQRNKARELQLEIQNLDRQIAEKQAEQVRLNGVIATYQQRIAAVPTHESEMTELMRDYETLQKTYTSLLERREDSKTSADLERRQIGEQFKILDPAREPERPISPKRPQLYALGTIVGLALGLGLAGLLEYRDTSLKTEDDVVQMLALPVLALIPMMASRPVDSALQRRRVVVISCAATIVLFLSAFAAWKLDVIRWVR